MVDRQHDDLDGIIEEAERCAERWNQKSRRLARLDRKLDTLVKKDPSKARAAAKLFEAQLHKQTAHISVLHHKVEALTALRKRIGAGERIPAEERMQMKQSLKTLEAGERFVDERIAGLTEFLRTHGAGTR